MFRKPEQREPYFPGDFTLKLLLPGGKVINIPMPESEASLRVDLINNPAFDLRSGSFHVALNRIVFTG
jgi:hypothetical protein